METSDPEDENYEGGHYDPDEEEEDEEPVSAELEGYYKRVVAMAAKMAGDGVDRATRVSRSCLVETVKPFRPCSCRSRSSRRLPSTTGSKYAFPR